ncbi:MAG: lycopene cyclase domain-containing protein [Candidatus Dojkabacteria bacterium]|uniref:Lycopene cyclase domain-containing protein n=2 Tax=Candidatus Dojkabacteria TaxID=74243 RepID=A0A136KFA1_9BACT|nr:MAG: hypothetical protein UZ20_WS6002001000 [candidate division WS6 bacterium OLB21]MBW7953928.1 lycopene cyclase domain-containing protein [Candidatus Dojkabacteria bacterium]WKZ27501.1 MAG: lycopene cyclase domain-containing protein [Candidatus Dojkabacteria bacterium]
MNYSYLLLNLIILIGPLLLSFEKRVRYISKIKHVLISIFLVSIPFILWDQYATLNGHWSFSKEHTTGINIGMLPIEEVMFFLTVPFSCLFVYEVINYFFKDKKTKVSAYVFAFVGALLSLIAFTNPDKGYTLIVSTLGSSLFFALAFIRPVLVMKRNYLIFLAVTLVLFLVFNSILTGIPIVSYGADEILGIRIGTIPIEDFVYNSVMLTLYLLVYNWSKMFFKKD